MYEYMDKYIFAPGQAPSGMTAIEFGVHIVVVQPLTRTFHVFEPRDSVVPLTLSRPGPCDRRVQKWASHVYPGLHTLSIASTLRVESSNSALKLVMTRSGTMADVDRAIVGKVQDDANKTLRWAFLGIGWMSIFDGPLSQIRQNRP